MNKKIEEFFKKCDALEKERINLRIKEKEINDAISNYKYKYGKIPPNIELYTNLDEIKEEIRYVLNENSKLCKNHRYLFRVEYETLKKALAPRKTELYMRPVTYTQERMQEDFFSILQGDKDKDEALFDFVYGSHGQLYVSDDKGLMKNPIRVDICPYDLKTYGGYKFVKSPKDEIILRKKDDSEYTKLDLYFNPERVLQMKSSMYTYSQDTHEPNGIASQRTYDLFNAIVENAKEQN